MKRKSNACAAMLLRSINEMQLAELEMNSAISRYNHLKDITGKKIEKSFFFLSGATWTWTWDYNEVKRRILEEYPNL